jgi:hypothetical protein
MRGSITRHTCRTFGLATLVATLALAHGGPAEAFKEVEPGKTGMVGIVRGQTARLNAVRIDDPNTTPPDDSGRACTAELSLLDGTGNVLTRSMESLAAGHSAFLDFAIDDPNARPGQRQQLRAVLRAVPPDTGDRRGRAFPPDPCAGLVATLEVFQSETGETTVILNPAVIRGFNPQPDPPGIGGAPLR